MCRKTHRDDCDLSPFRFAPGLFKHRLFSAAKGHRGCLLFLIVISNSSLGWLKFESVTGIVLVPNKCITLTVTWCCSQ